MRAVDALLERTFDAEQRHFWFRGFKRFVAPLLQQATAGLTHPRLLDAGCGTGTNLIFLRRYGTPYGLELHWRGLQFAHERGLPRLTQGSVTALPYVDSSMDVVVSFDVLYCLPAPAEAAAISEMYRVLKPGGALIVNVAAMNMLKGDHSVLGGEVRRYTRRRAARKTRSAPGFVWTRITHTNAFLFPITATVRWFQRLRGLKTESQNRGDFYVPPAPVNALFSGALALESILVAAGVNMPVGSSLLCLARKAVLADFEAENTKSQRAAIRAARTLVRHERLVGFDRNHPVRGGERRSRNLHGQLEILGGFVRSPVSDFRRGRSRVAARRNSAAAIPRRSSA